MADGPFDPETGELISRAPSLEDLVSLWRKASCLRIPEVPFLGLSSGHGGRLNRRE